jgi:hypothetical protein
MDYASVRVRPVPWVGSCGATANILLVHDPRGLADAPKRRSKGGMGLGVERRIALIGVRFLARNDRICDHAAHLRGTLAALETFADRGAALHAFRNSPPSLVKGMIAAERMCFVALLVSGIIRSTGYGPTRDPLSMPAGQLHWLSQSATRVPRPRKPAFSSSFFPLVSCRRPVGVVPGWILSGYPTEMKPTFGICRVYTLLI